MLGPASDIYSLGATLYVLLTGRAPCTDPNMMMLLAAVQMGEYPRPSQVKPGVAPALEAICQKAMALQPGERYESAAALAGDVVYWLADEPVGAWREPWGVQARRWEIGLTPVFKPKTELIPISLSERITRATGAMFNDLEFSQSFA